VFETPHQNFGTPNYKYSKYIYIVNARDMVIIKRNTTEGIYA